MHTYTPNDSTVAECYMDVGNYCWFKAGIMGIVALVLFPLIELAGLNRARLTEEQYNSFLMKQGVSVDQARDLEGGDGLDAPVRLSY
jgi:hypothetical protein